ncbi:unnamed protein product [Penicillium egyptiacum]|uniref:Uncharacterized protein n=1 Tax=Penicillium egyptiacum TaxID=1303716 RepID=A0A9W4KJJ1_9EURO|nr:unnamed protein product [Penicillium egyptiacum]
MSHAHNITHYAVRQERTFRPAHLLLSRNFNLTRSRRYTSPRIKEPIMTTVGRAQALGYMAVCMHRQGKELKKKDCTIYGIEPDWYIFVFLKINNDSKAGYDRLSSSTLRYEFLQPDIKTSFTRSWLFHLL